MATENFQSKRLDNVPIQRKSTLKWSSNGELTSIDMARILERLADPDLTKCELSCNLNKPENESRQHGVQCH